MKIVAGNWKMNLTPSQSEELVRALLLEPADPSVASLIFPPFTSLDRVSKLVASTSIKLGAQDLSPHEKGAYTGDISGEMLMSLGCQYVLVGHSERRQLHHEDNRLLNQKLMAAWRVGLMPVYCVGETLQERDSNQAKSVISTQLLEGLRGAELANAPLIVAYEPVWAIGTGKVATPEQAEEMHDHIRRELSIHFGDNLAKKIAILYGGSVKADNCASLKTQPNVDGVLVGGASLIAGDFSQIMHHFQEEKK